MPTTDDGVTHETGSDSLTSGSESTTTSSSSATSSVDESGSSTGAPSPGRIEQAAQLACAAASHPIAYGIPEGNSLSADFKIFFEIGNQFPYRFQLNEDHPEANRWSEGYHCSIIVRDPDEFDAGNVEEWWWYDKSWVTEDGEVEVFMATNDIENVRYAGPNTELEGNWPSLPVVDGVHFDISDICPDYPDLWIPPGDPPDSLEICWRFERPIAEAIFVRVP